MLCRRTPASPLHRESGFASVIFKLICESKKGTGRDIFYDDLQFGHFQKRKRLGFAFIHLRIHVLVILTKHTWLCYLWILYNLTIYTQSAHFHFAANHIDEKKFAAVLATSDFSALHSTDLFLLLPTPQYRCGGVCLA